MKLKTIALAALLAANGAHAAPTTQTCSPMEVAHNGGSGLSYSLACEAGTWSLQYTGSVPAGTESVLARYRVQVRNPDGSQFTQNRSVRVPSPSMLGQALIREAVMLDNGDLALRDCPDFGCTLYRPLGSAEKLAKATITVTPEIKRLSEEASRLTAELAKRQSELDAQNGKVASLQRDVAGLTAKLDGAQQSLSDAKTALASAKEQYTADISGLLTSTKADVDKAAAAAGAKSSAQIADLTAQLATVSGALDAARKDLTKCMAEHTAADAAKAKADAEVAARGKKVGELQAALATAEAHLKSVLDGADAKLADLNSKQSKASAAQSAEVAAARLKLDAANRQVEGLLTKVAGLERALTDANKQLQTAKTAQTAHQASLSTAASNQDKQRVTLEAALATAQRTIADLTAARASQVGELQASLATANTKLAAAQDQLTALASPSTQSTSADIAELESARTQLKAATARADELTQKVAGLEKALVKANTGALTATSADSLALGRQLAEVTAQRDAAVADGRKFMADLDANAKKINQLTAERQAALLGAQQVAKDMLEALDKFQDLQEAKDESDKALAATTNKLMDLSAKLQAANMTRDLAMQAAGAANADADTQNLKNQELAKRLARAEEQLAALRAERDALGTKQQGAPAESVPAPAASPAPAAAVPGAGRGEVDALTTTIGVIRHERNKLQENVIKNKQHIEHLEGVNAAQAREIAELRRQLAAANSVKSAP